MTTQTFSELTDGEKTWIEYQINQACEYISIHSPADMDSPITLEVLDRTWAAWLATDPKGGDEVNPVVNAIGTCFGSIFVETGIFDWTVVTDDYGTEIAIRALPGKGDVLVFPTNFVAKRWESKDPTFMACSYGPIMDTVTRWANEGKE